MAIMPVDGILVEGLCTLSRALKNHLDAGLAERFRCSSLSLNWSAIRQDFREDGRDIN